MKRLTLHVALAIVALAALPGCSGMDWTLVHGNLAAGGLKLDTGLEWYTGVGERLAADPASVPAAERTQFTQMGAALRKISLGLNIILGNYDLTAAGWVRRNVPSVKEATAEAADLPASGGQAGPAENPKGGG